MKNLGTIRRTSAFILVFTTMAAAAGIGMVGCEPAAPTVAEYLDLSGIQEQERIRIGVLVDTPLLGVKTAGAYSGFDVEIGRYLARSLGFETEGDRGIEWVPTKLEDRLRAITEGRADLVIATFSITEARRREINFAGPYLITSQEIMVDPSVSGRFQTFADLAREEVVVCVPDATTSVINVAGSNLRTDAGVNSRECLDGLASGDYQVMTTDEVVLAGLNNLVNNEFEIVDVPLEVTEKYGIGVSKNNPHLQALVEHYLLKSYNQPDSSSPWRLAWEETIGLADWPSDNARRQPQPDVSVALRDIDDRVQQPDTD